MLKRKKITSKGEWERFVLIFEMACRGHKSVALSYLENARVTVFYHPKRPDEWIAGYVVNSSTPFRYFEVLSDTKKTNLLAQFTMLEGEISEVTCIWIDNTKASKKERLQVYFYSMIDAFKAGKKYIFGGSTEQKVMAIQKPIMPHDFADGIARIGDEVTPFQIYYVGRWESIYTMSRFLIRQLFDKKRRNTPPVVTSPLPQAI
ncbi:hypothetical protein [Runella sp.]|uniref:hypothetical protein n=1 Tax=Runella sp. TaxID=1960881 RepID=UPI003016B5B4